MSTQVDLRLRPELLENREHILQEALKKAQIPLAKVSDWRIRKRSIDARNKPVQLQLQIEIWQDDQTREPLRRFIPQNVHNAPRVAIIGAGPAGLYAALRAIEAGLKPVVFERGKDVRQRRRDLAKINKEHLVNPESNYCFGEGGAGTYSDGKLYTRSKKRGNVLKALEWLVHFGADQDILVDAHPHIGTNKLPQLIIAIREAILEAGGEVHFNAKLTDLLIQNNQVTGLVINNSRSYDFQEVILATGHSARDVFYLLYAKGIKIEAKAFALGVRVEHRQEVINYIQYHGETQNPFLPPAAYSLVEQVDGKGVYSFCMCPGGIIAPCATQQDEVVTNGWSPSKRNNPYANSGIVVGLDPQDLPGYTPGDALVCLNFQKGVEQACWEAGGKTQRVPAQRMTDFIKGVKSKDFPKTSYQPGIVSVNLHEVLPPLIANRLQKAFVAFGKKMPGYLSHDAILHAPESRTSSPVSIPRDGQSLEHVKIKGLYPCGEGAGYAGGIMSAAIDGINCADAVALKYALK